MKKIIHLLVVLLLIVLPFSSLAIEYPCTGISLKASVNVRMEANKKSTTLDKLKKNQEVPVLGEITDKSGVVWYEIEYKPGKTGFISCEYIDIPEPVEEELSIASFGNSVSALANTPQPVSEKKTETVYLPKSGSKYHYSSTCSNMKNPKSATLEEAIAKGYGACSKCAGGSSKATAKTSQQTAKTSQAQTAQQTSETKKSGVSVYVTSSGKKYHSSSKCSNMKNPQKISIEDAKAKGYTACSKCY